MNRTRILVISLSLVAVAAIAAGCDKKSDTQSIPPGAAASPSDGDAQAALTSYEAIRALLAKDETRGIADEAEKVRASASAASAKATAPTKPYLDAMARSASALKEKSTDLESARVAFGELSRHVVALLAADPKLRQGRHLYECPMAQGYKKWVQTKEGVDNPYMGKKMPDCGGASAWET